MKVAKLFLVHEIAYYRKIGMHGVNFVGGTEKTTLYVIVVPVAFLLVVHVVCKSQYLGVGKMNFYR